MDLTPNPYTAETPQFVYDSTARALFLAMAKDEPMEGMSATYGIGSDSYAYTIVQVHSGKRITVLMASTDVADRFYVDPFDGVTVDRAKVLTKRANDLWVQEGQPGGRKQCGHWVLGIGIDYRDPSF